MAFNSSTENTGFITSNGLVLIGFIFLAYLLFFADGHDCCFNCIRRRLYGPPDVSLFEEARAG